MGERLIRELIAAVDRGEPVVLATVVGTNRSVPRHAGSKRTARPPSGAPAGSKVAAEAEGWAHGLRDCRSAMQPGTSCGDTVSHTRESSPAASRAVMKSFSVACTAMGRD